ncbi:MAG: hypothetical protein GQ561_06925 [Calditrichae bacterium]|nr:hypothetical protein [Calditrichia bacterium]
MVLGRPRPVCKSLPTDSKGKFTFNIFPDTLDPLPACPMPGGQQAGGIP